jgi:hypothetical protein
MQNIINQNFRRHLLMPTVQIHYSVGKVTMLKLDVILIGFILAIVNAAKRDPVLQKELDDWVKRLFGNDVVKTSTLARVVEIPDHLKELVFETERHGELSKRGIPHGTNTMRSVQGTIKPAHAGQVLVDFSNPKSLDGLFMGLVDLEHEIVVAAELKVFWKPTLALKRSKGSFKFSALDVVNKKKDILIPLDVTKVYHRDEELDQGWYTFEVTPALTRWLNLKAGKPKELLLQRSSMKVKLPSKDKVVELLPKGEITSVHLMIYSQDLRFLDAQKTSRVEREAKRSVTSHSNVSGGGNCFFRRSGS